MYRQAVVLQLPLFLRIFYKRNRQAINFVGKFLLFYLIGQAAYIYLRPTISPFLTEKSTAAVSAHIINLLTPGEHAKTTGPVIIGTVSLKIAVGCDGVDGLILIVAAICAFPMSRLRKLAGIGVGIAVIYFANLLRVVVLYYTFRFRPDLFSFVHMYAGQVFIIFVGFLFFLSWIGRTSLPQEAAQ